ncbi:pyrroline-5-carboxylate reductase family protein [Anaerosporobacter faecicola]|uniref:pyrroline-5-carboxylate reductase family protein n=1 Tax=Anaerosporobacter faecicola TaxID=2718714 RepID=UPI0014396ADA|nr:NAD(P)-binding domain-containing protein [Anaerosporobacter faecicola]
MKIGIIGFGHLAKSFVKGLLAGQLIDKNSIFITAKSRESRKIAADEYGINYFATNKELIHNTDIIFITIPPKVFRSEFIDIQPIDCMNKNIISFMAGVKVIELASAFINAKISRAMPNVGIEKCKGIIGYTPTENSTVLYIFHHLGDAFLVKEEDIEKVTAFASCGIGFASYTLNCFYEVGKQLGFCEEDSLMIISNIFSTSLQSNRYQQLITEVATKGGATEAGIKSFEENEYKNIIKSVFMHRMRR